MDLYELFNKATDGWTLFEDDLNFLKFYVSIGEEKDTMFLIEQMSETYEDPARAEVGFIAVWSVLEQMKKDPMKQLF